MDIHTKGHSYGVDTFPERKHIGKIHTYVYTRRGHTRGGRDKQRETLTEGHTHGDDIHAEG